MDISSLTVAKIRELADQNGEPTNELLAAMAMDKRSAVVTMYKRYLKARQMCEVNRQRLEKMKLYERSLAVPHHQAIAGVDEVGRGPLAGPVLAAAVILPKELLLEGLDDSKKLTPAKREILDIKIKNSALDWAIGLATVKEIELFNIHNASMLAMQRAVHKLTLKSDLILVDGRFILSDVETEQKAIVGGDGLCPSVAAASVVAKVARDHLMQIYHTLYPKYGFDKHKGYGTAMHLAALTAFGSCPVHRRGFDPVRKLINKQ